MPNKAKTVQFRIENGGQVETCIMRIDGILCLFPDRMQVRTIEHGWTLNVFEDDWEKVVGAFLIAEPR